MVGNPTRGFREASQGSAALKGVTRDDDVVNGSVQEKAVLDDPVPEMAACRTDILLIALFTFSTQVPIHTQTSGLRYPLLHYYPA